MWLGHFIEHLMCIGGELEHHKALPSPARKKQSTQSSGVLCSRAAGIYSHIHWSRFVSLQPGPMDVGQERGPLVPVRVWNRNKRVQTNRDQCPTRPGRPPGRTNRDVCPHGSRFVTEPGLMGWPGLNQSPVFY